MMTDFLIQADHIQQPVISLKKDGELVAMNSAAQKLNLNLQEIVNKLNPKIQQPIIFGNVSWTVTIIDGNYLLVGSDISAYKSLQELLENQQSYLDFVVANIPCYIYWKDRHSIYLGCNEKFAKAAGLEKPADIIGKSDYDLAWGETEADLFREGDVEVLNGKALIDFEEPQLMANGKYATVLANKVPIRNKSKEIIGVLGIYLDITERKQAEEAIKQAKLRAESFGQIATQAAHDIRSPIAALEAMVPALREIAEAQRILIRNAIDRIKDIANNLLIQHKTKEKLLNIFSQSQTPILLILESIISEKRTQYKLRDIQFSTEVSSKAYTLFANMKQHNFKRLLSNIIDNAVEAIKRKGEIFIKLSANTKKVILSISDNGVGIPEDILPKVFNHDFTYGKKEGSGLGLPYAKKCIEEWGGSIKIESTSNQGTEVIIALNLLPPPEWYPKEITVNPDMTIVVLDDDKSGHDMWNQRFSDKNIQLIHFHQSTEFMAWVNQHQDKKIIFLMDYELINDAMTGLDLIEQCKLQDRAILVTSHFEDEALQKRCMQSKVRLFPKMLTNYIPIHLVNSKLDLIYLDDDPDVTSAWEWLAESVGKNILTFNYVNDFMKHIDHCEKDIVIYIDSDLGVNNIKGEDLAKVLYDKGYKNIYLATGYGKNNFEEMPWIKGILNKTPDILLGGKHE